MKKQINRNIKTHHTRVAFYLLLLLALCAIPFALAQQPGAQPGHATRPNADRSSASADTILNHMPQQAPQQAPLSVPKPPAGNTDCDNEPGIIIHDDGGIENGYSGNPGLVTEVRFTDKFTPGSYPASFTSVCLDFVVLAGGPPTYPIDVVVFDDDGPGGVPGTLLGELNGQTAVTHPFVGGGQAPIWNSYDISSLGINVTSGSVYIGARWVPPSNNVFLSADESGPVGFAGGYWWNNFDGVWSQTQNAFPGYTANMIRAVQSGGGTPTPTPTPPPCTWSAGPDMPSPDVRSVGVFFPANGKFYAMGGRAFDGGGGEFTNPFEYDPVSNSWTTKSAAYPDNQVNNMACGVLNDAGTDYIYCVGGSESATSTTTGRVFRYDPVADVITTVAGGNWPPGANTTLPGGFAVFSNQLFTLGGFDILNGVGIDPIWQFTPSPAGWVQKNTVLPVPLGYIPTTTIGGLIYTGGGSDITAGTLTDTTNSFKYDPVADSISTIAPIPRATGETRALNFNGQMYVMGGGRVAPNPSNEVDIYDPGTDTWSVGIPFSNARRNFPTGTNGTDHIWLAGGYDVDGLTPLASMEIFECTTSGELTLSAFARRERDGRAVALSWTPADGGTINVIRDGVILRTVDDDGRAQDHLGRGPREVHVYQVCETDTGTCSNEVKVKILGTGGDKPSSPGGRPIRPPSSH
jgi:hypothetical protein